MFYLHILHPLSLAACIRFILYYMVKSDLSFSFFLTFRFESSVDRIVNDMFWLEIQYHIRSKGERNGREWETKNIMCK